MSSTRINITSSYSFGRTYGIDRTMPAIMIGRMSEYEWEHFCNQIDSHIVPLNKNRYILLGGTIAVVVGFLVIMVRSISNFSKDSNISSSSTNPFVFFLIPLAFMIGLVGLSCYFSTVSNRAFDQVRQICESSSRNNNHKVSFHLRDDRMVIGGYNSGMSSSYRVYHNMYIEVSLNHINVMQMLAKTQINQVVDIPLKDIESG